MSLDDTGSARSIYQELLDRIGASLSDRNFASFSDHIALPHWFETFDARVDIDNEQVLRDVFDAMCDRLDRIGVHGPTRHCNAAEFLAPDTIRGSHRTWLISSDSNTILDEYSSLSTLKCVNGIWRVSHSQYAGAADYLPARVASQLNRQELPRSAARAEAKARRPA